MAAPQLSLKGRALRYLSMREHSRMELARKLARYAEEGDDVEALLDLQEQKAGLAEGETERCVEVWNRKFGTVAADPQERNKQMRFLLQRGFSQRAVQTALKGAPEDD